MNDKHYHNKTWGLYINPWEAVYAAKLDSVTTNKKDHFLSKDEQFAIYWCFSRAMDYVEKHSPLVNPYPDSDLIVNGVNITETIKNLLGRLVV